MQMIEGEKKIKCTRCDSGTLRRRQRRGFIEKTIYPLLGLYPWRCDRCKHTITLRDRGTWRLPSGSKVVSQTVHQVMPQTGKGKGAANQVHSESL